MTGVFVSHAHSYEPLVRVLAQLLMRLFNTKIGVLGLQVLGDPGGGCRGRRSSLPQGTRPAAFGPGR